jgi:hypothetical protein
MPLIPRRPTAAAPGLAPAASVILITGVLGLLVLFAFEFASFMYFRGDLVLSRELAVGRSSYGFSQTVKTHVVAAADPFAPRALIAAVDGSQLKIIQLAADGSTEAEWQLEADLSDAIAIAPVIPAADRLFLYFQTGGLELLDVNLIDGTSSRRELAPAIRDFRTAGDLVVYRTDGGLYTLDQAFEPVRLAGPEVRSFAMAALPGGTARRGQSPIYLATVESVSGAGGQIRSMLYGGPVLGDLSAMPESVELVSAGREDYYRNLVDLRASGTGVSALYLFEDNRFAVNYLSFIRASLPLASSSASDGAAESSGRLLSHREALPFFNSRYTLIDASPFDGTDAVIFQREDLKGVNLAILAHDYGRPIGPEGTTSRVRDLTDTRYLSRLGAYLTIGEMRMLVFSDLRNDHRQLYVASGHPDAVARGRELAAADYAYIAGMTAVLAAVATVLGFLYVLASFSPTLVAGVLFSRIGGRSRKAYVLRLTAGTLVYLPVKLGIMSSLLVKPANTIMFPFPDHTWAYVAGFLTLAAAYLITLVGEPSPDQDRSGSISALLRLLFRDYAFTVPLFLIYIVGSVLIRSI